MHEESQPSPEICKGYCQMKLCLRVLKSVLMNGRRRTTDCNINSDFYIPDRESGHDENMPLFFQSHCLRETVSCEKLYHEKEKANSCHYTKND